MKLTFVNHASVLFEHAGIKLITDPWLEGDAFDHGWDLLVPSAMQPADLADVDYIWYSHEHPDHFSPGVLMKIPEQARRHVTILYHETAGKRVVSFAKNKGFNVRELKRGEALELGPDFKVRCESVPFYDSWLLIEADGVRVFNLNDCVVRSPADCKALAKKIGPIDVLMTQFSYASWQGNPDEPHIREHAARTKLETIAHQVRALRPRFVIPFASFVYFSHEENLYQNDRVNRPHAAVQAIEEADSQAIVLYPGDEWAVGRTYDNDSALKKWATAYDKIPSLPRHTATTVSLDALSDQALAFDKRMADDNSAWMVQAVATFAKISSLGPLRIYLTDHESLVSYHYGQGLRLLDSNDQCDVFMGSESLSQVFTVPWGIDTLAVNSRFRTTGDGLKRLSASFGVALLNNSDVTLSPALITNVESMRFFWHLCLRMVRRMRQSRQSTS